MLDALGIPRLSVAGYEADDLIATLATQAEQAGMDVLDRHRRPGRVPAGREHVTVLMTRRGISDMTRFTPAAVAAKYGLTPAQYPDFAALRGDPSDNLPGIPGVGEKTAAKWVAEFGSLDELVDRVDEVKGKAGDKPARAPRPTCCATGSSPSWTATCRWTCRPRRARPGPWDREQIHQLFDTLQFRVLRDRLYATLPNGIGGRPPRPTGAEASDFE